MKKVQQLIHKSFIDCTFYTLVFLCFSFPIYAKSDQTHSKQNSCDDSVLSNSIETLNMMTGFEYVKKTKITLNHHQKNNPGQQGQSNNIVIMKPLYAQDGKKSFERKTYFKSPFGRRGQVRHPNTSLSSEQVHPGLFLKSSGQEVICTYKDKVVSLTINFADNHEQVEITGKYREFHEFRFIPEHLKYQNQKDSKDELNYYVDYDQWTLVKKNTWVPFEITVRSVSKKTDQKVTTINQVITKLQKNLPKELLDKTKQQDKKLEDQLLKEWKEYIDQPLPPFYSN